MRREWWRLVWQPEYVCSAVQDFCKHMRAHLRAIDSDTAKVWPLAGKAFPQPDRDIFERLVTLTEFPPEDADPEEWSSLMHLLAVRARTDETLHDDVNDLIATIESRIQHNPAIVSLDSHSDTTTSMLIAFKNNQLPTQHTTLENQELHTITDLINRKPTNAYNRKHDLWKRGTAKCMRLESGVIVGSVDYFGLACRETHTKLAHHCHDQGLREQWEPQIELMLSIHGS